MLLPCQPEELLNPLNAKRDSADRATVALSTWHAKNQFN